MKSAVLCLLFLFAATCSAFSTLEFTDTWQEESNLPREYAENPRGPAVYRLYSLDIQTIRSFLQRAPTVSEYLERRRTDTFSVDDKVISLPTPKGSIETFRVFESDVLSPEVAAANPDIRTYHLYGKSNENLRGSLTFGKSLGAQVFIRSLISESDPATIPSFRLEPVSNFHLKDRALANEEVVPSEVYKCFWSRDYMWPSQSVPKTPGCTSNDKHVITSRSNGDYTQFSREDLLHMDSDKLYWSNNSQKKSSSATKRDSSIGTLRRNYRLIVAAASEFTTNVGGTGSVANAITNVMNGVNSIYNSELNVNLNVVDTMIYSNSGTDPWANDCNTDLDVAKTTILNTKGVNNFDIGHVFEIGNLGLAYIGVVCNSVYKAGGCIGFPDPAATSYILGTSHEMGHQFGAQHTHSSSVGFCGGAQLGTKKEPGGGSTIMAYGAVCTNDTYIFGDQDSYFLGATLQEMTTYITEQATCSSTGSANNLPVVTIVQPSSTISNIIPFKTPFKLIGSATDADGDTLTYSWEQNSSPAGGSSLSLPDDGEKNLFRSYPAVSEGFRIFPKNPEFRDPSKGERMQSVSRSSMPFNFIVRDGKGHIIDQSVSLVVDASVGPFSVTTTALTTGQSNTIEWSVAGTDALSTNVAVKLFDSSTGEIVSVKLGVSNSGSTSICVPETLSVAGTYKLRIEASAGIWFDQKTVTLTAGTGTCTPTTCDSGTETIDTTTCKVAGSTGQTASSSGTASGGGSSPASTVLPPSWTSYVL